MVYDFDKSQMLQTSKYSNSTSIKVYESVD